MERPIECGFTKIGMGKIEEELIKFKNFMDDIGVEFFLVAGVCLGLVRNGALIKCDKDFDFGVMNERDLYKIEKEAKLLDYYDEIHITGEQNGKILWLKKYFGNYCLPIEIIAHYTKDGCVYYNRNMGPTWEYRKGRVVYAEKLFDVFGKVNFRGIDFNVPNPVDEYLAAFFGDDWRIPKEYTDWRYNCANLFPGWWL